MTTLHDIQARFHAHVILGVTLAVVLIALHIAAEVVTRYRVTKATSELFDK